MKCGTTTLHRILDSHPEIFIPPGEVKIFDIDDIVQHSLFFRRIDGKWSRPDFEECFEEYREWYQSLYKNRMGFRIAGEDSPTYLASKRALERISRLLPTVKIVVMLRDPVERTYSHYWHNVRNFNAFFRFDECLRYSPGLMLQRSFYKPQIEILFQFFPRKQVKIILLEELQVDCKKTIQEVCDFLDIDAGMLSEDSFSMHCNRGNVPRFLGLTLWRNFLFRDFQGRRYLGFLPGLPHCEPISWIRKSVLKIHSRVNPNLSEKPSPMNCETRKFLSKLFRRENDGLGELIGKDVMQYWESFRNLVLRRKFLKEIYFRYKKIRFSGFFNIWKFS